MAVITGRSVVEMGAPRVRQSLMSAKLHRTVVSGMTSAMLERARAVIKGPDSHNSKARAFMALFDQGRVNFDDARRTVTSVAKLWEGLESPGDRKFELQMPDDIYSALPELAIDRIAHILGSSFSRMTPGSDYAKREGRSVYFNLPEPLTINGRLIKQIKLKGVCFDAGAELVPFTGNPPWIDIEFSAEGKIKSQTIQPFKARGAMEMKAVNNEYSLMELAFRKGGRVVCPLGMGIFNDATYQNEPLGFVIHGLEGSEHDLRTAFASLLGEGLPKDGHFRIRINLPKAEANRGKIADLFSTVGRTYRVLHDIGITQGALHPGNILVTPELEVSIPDFESGRSLSGTTLVQNVAYRAMQVRSFLGAGLRLHLNDQLLYDMDKVWGINVAQLFLAGYFYDRPARQYGIDILAKDQINDLIAELHLGNTEMSHPLMDELKTVAGKVI